MSGWGVKFETVVRSWEGGVHASARPDLIPESSLPMVVNGSFTYIGDGTAVVAKRPGTTLINDAGTSLGTTIVGQYFFAKRNTTTGAYTDYHVLVEEDGDLDTINDSNGTVTGLTGEFSTSLAGKFVSAETANNAAYFVANAATTAGGVAGDGLRFDGTNLRVFGMDKPAAPTAVATSVGVMSGTWDVALTYYNSDTGYESSRSPSTSISLTAEQLKVDWSAPADAQVTHVRVHLRDQTISTGYYQATSIAIAATTVTLNVSTDDYNAFITASPDEYENEPVPTGTKYLSWHKSRMFAATDTEIYYSKVELPESFDPEKYESVNPDDGQKIQAIISAFDRLVVLKDLSLYVLVGDGPSDWTIAQVSRKIGCVAPQSVVYADGLLYWWSVDGPVVWDGQGEPVRLGKTLIEQIVSLSALNPSRLNQIVGIDDRAHERILWAVPLSSETKNNVMIPFKYRLGGFEGVWFGNDVASAARGRDTNSVEWVYLGGYNGRVYKLGEGDYDGLPADAVATGTFTATTSSYTVLSGSGLNTTTGYEGLYVTLLEEDSKEVIGRKRITTSTATTITVTAAFEPLAVGTTYRYYIGGIDFQFDTKWQDDQQPFYKKRYEFLFAQFHAEEETTAFIELGFDFATAEFVQRTITITPKAVGGTTSLWDLALWDTSLWSAYGPKDERLRAARVARNWRLRVYHSIPTVDFAIYKVGMRGEYLTFKR